MATFADYDDNEGGDDNSSVTICPDGDAEADVGFEFGGGGGGSNSSQSPINNHQNGTQTPTPLCSNNVSSSATKCTPCSQSKTMLQLNNGSNHNASTSAQTNTSSNNIKHNDSVGEEQSKFTGSGSVAIRAANNVGLNASATNSGLIMALQQQQQQQHQPEATATASTGSSGGGGVGSSNAKNLLLCRRFKDSGDSLRNFTSLPLFIYATSPSTHATSADGVGVAQVAVKAAEEAAAAANMKKVRRLFYLLLMCHWKDDDYWNSIVVHFVTT